MDVWLIQGFKIFNSVPQISRFLLADAIISSKTKISAARRRREAMLKVKNNKTLPTTLSFIYISYLK